MNANVILTKETKAKLNKKMSGVQKGQMLFDRLTMLDQTGTLSKAKNRREVATLMGYSSERMHAGYAWVSNLIKAKKLRETLVEIGPKGAEYEYHVVNLPTKSSATVETSKAKAVDVPPVEPTAIADSAIKIEITKGDLSIKIELRELSQLESLVKTIIKGE